MQGDIPIRKVDTYEYMKIVQELLAEGRDVPLVVTGNSMLPFLVHERDQILISRIDRPLKKGDMAFFRRKTGQYIMHRIYAIKRERENGEENYYFIGDAQTVIEGPIDRDQIFGVINVVYRKGKHLEKGSFWWFFFEHIWLHMIPLRKAAALLYGFTVGRIKKLIRKA